jgi:hypothetical protein
MSLNSRENSRVTSDPEKPGSRFPSAIPVAFAASVLVKRLQLDEEDRPL